MRDRLGGLRARMGGVVRDTGWQGFNEVAILVTSLCTFYVLTKGLGRVGYGRYVGTQALAATLTMLSSAWVVMLLLQHAIQNERGLRRAFSSALALAVTAAGLGFVVAMVVAPLLLPNVPLGVVAGFVGAELVGGVAISVTASAVQIARGFAAATRVRMVLVLTRFGVVVTLFLLDRATLASLAFWQVLSVTAVGAVVLLTMTGRLDISPIPGRPRARDLRDGLPYAGVLAAFAVQEDGDKTLLGTFGYDADAGLYSAAYRLVQLGAVPIRALIGSSHPRFLVDTPGVKDEHLRRSVQYTVPMAAYAAVAVVALEICAPLVPRILGAEYEDTVPILRAVAPLVLLRSLSLFAFNGLMGLGRYGTRVGILAVTTTVNIGLNLALIPSLSWRGAVIATIATEVVFAGLAWLALVRFQRERNRSVDDGTSPPRSDPPEPPEPDTAPQTVLA